MTTDLGLFEQTRKRADRAKFRAPTLRNIAVTAPYMHDGSIPTLELVIEHYAAGGRPGAPKDDLIRGFTISPTERDDVIAFLDTLTDEAFLANPALGPP